MGGARRIDFELLALRAGLKPAVRLSAGPGEVAGMEGRLRAAGAHVVVARGFIPSERRERAVLWAARDARRAEELRDVEEATLVPGAARPEDLAARVRRTGELLGYPPCCLDAFVARLEATLRSAGPRPADAWRDAVAAWVPRPRALLDTLLRAVQTAPVSHEPCRFDCAESLAYAEACLREATRVDPEGARAAARLLATAVAVAPSGARALARVERGAPARIAAARPPGAADADARLARALVGAEVGERGALTGGGGPEPGTILVPFDLDAALADG